MTQAYKLLTPVPLTTTDSVKREMLVDRCTWDDDYKAVTQKIRRRLLELAQVSEQEYTAVLMQGSGTFGVESVLSSVVGAQDKLLICSNGAYGERQVQICEWNRIPYAHYAEAYDKVPDARKIADILARDPSITHVAMVHSETTTGILNDIQAVGAVVKAAGRTFIVDAMSSFGGVEIPVADWGVDFLISSANKCIQGVPGFSSSSAGVPPCWPARARRVRCRSTCSTSGAASNGTANGATPRRHMLCWRFPKRWRSWRRREAFRRATAATRPTTAC